MRVLVLAEHFPNIIQPWLLNWLEAALVGGCSLDIIADGALGNETPDRVRALGLHLATRYYPLESHSDAFRALARLIWTAASGRDSAASRFLATWSGVRRGNYSSAEIAKAMLRSRALSKRPALIHSHAIGMSDQYRFLADAWHVPLVTTFHGLPPVGVPLPSARACMNVFERSELFLVNTEFARRQLIGLGCPPEKTRILPQGTRLRDYPFRPREFSMDPLVILTVARLHRDKGHDYALAAVAELLRRGVRLEYRIVGGGPELARLRQEVTRLGLQRDVRLFGEISERELRQQYQEGQIFLLPSVRSQDGYHEETQGVVIQEAQASGLLVIATRTGGIPECVIDDENAFLVPDRDPDAIVERIQHLIVHAEQWFGWQKAARQHVEAHFDAEALGLTLLGHYERAVAGLPPLDDARLR